MIHAYVRVSVGREDESVSLEYQERDIRAAFDPKYPKITIHREAASAVKNDRPVFEELVPSLKSGDILLAWSVDRLARNEDDLPILSRLIASGVAVRTVRDGDFLTSETIFMFGIRLLVASEEVRRLKQRQKSRYEEGIKNGEWFFGVPLGYRRKGGTVTLDFAVSAVIPLLFRAYLAHPGGIASFLPEAKKILLPYGRKISRSRLHALLRNPMYSGRIAFRGVSGVGDFPAIVPEQLFAEVQSKLDGKRQKQATVHAHLYRGRVTCTCGRLLIGELQKGRVYYRCQSRTCPVKTVREDVIDTCVCGFFQEYDFTAQGVQFYIGKITGEKDERVERVRQDRERLSRLLSTAEKKRSGYIDMRAREELSAEEYSKKKTAADTEISELKKSLAEVGDTLPEIFNSVEKMLELLRDRFRGYDSANAEDKRLILNMLGSNFTLETEKGLQMHVYAFLKSFFDDECLVWSGWRDNYRTLEIYRQAVEEAVLKYSSAPLSSPDAESACLAWGAGQTGSKPGCKVPCKPGAN